MDETLIANWNHVVGPTDAVYHLGDFGFGSKGRMIQILKRLNGRIFLLKGNHDKAVKKDEVSVYFQWMKDYYELPIQDSDLPGGKMKIVLSHYAHRVWNKSHWNAFHLFGHSHGRLEIESNCLSMDVGVDAIAQRLSGKTDLCTYAPISYYEVKSILLGKINNKNL